MLPPGRRRGLNLLALLFLFLVTTNAASSVLGIDFGTLNLKAALVKPGIPLEIVLSKDSKRKETAAVAFKPNRDSKNAIVTELGTFPERLYGGDALALQGRLPGEVFPNLKPLLGVVSADGSAVETYKSRFPSVKVESLLKEGTVAIESEAFVTSEKSWSVEELLAMELANVKTNAESLAGKGSVVQDAVITIPAFYTAQERRAIERAADLAGLIVNALVTDGLGVGLDYAKSRTFPEVTAGEKPEHHIVFDMGAGSTTATLLRFQSRSVKDIGRFNKTVQEVAVLGAGWDRTLGGDSLNDVLLNDYIQKFLDKPAVKDKGVHIDQVTSNGRVMSRLWKDVEKARQVLSANTETSSSFEELLPDIDFRTKVTRTEFETLAAPFADRVLAPIEDALATAKLTIKDIDSIILHGGAVRTPFVQKKLESLAGSSKLRSNVNADESAVFGAAFKGAGISPSFKVKEIRDSDIANYPAGILYSDGGKPRRQVLFNPSSAVGSAATTKQVTFKEKDDFTIQLFQAVDGADVPLSHIETSNLTLSVKQLQSKFGCEREDISTKFSIRLSPVDGLPEIIGGSVSCEVEGSGKSGSVGDSVKDWLGLGKKKDQEPLQDDEGGPTEEVEAQTASATASDSSASASESATSSKAPEKPTKRTETVHVAFSTAGQGNSQFTADGLKQMRDRLSAFDRSDRARFAREEALNVLESYTYFVRDFLTNDDYSVVSTDDQRSGISKILDETRAYLESDAAKAGEEVLKDKLASLKSLVEPIQLRKKEADSRPNIVKNLRDSLEQTKKLIDSIKEQVEKAATETSAATAESTTSDDLADLEEPETKTATTTAQPSVSPYTMEDLLDITKSYEAAKEWFEEKVAAQDKLNAFDDPVLKVKEMKSKAEALSKAMSELIYKKIKKPTASSKKSKPAKTKSSKTKTTAVASESATSAEGQPKIFTVNLGDDMPTEEDILQRVNEAKQQGEDPIHSEL